MESHPLMKDSLARIGACSAPQALAWKALLGQEVPAHFALPTNTKRLKPNKERPRATLPTVLTAYPNPSNGPVYLVYNVPEGVEQAHLRMVDASGRLVLEQRIADRTGIIEVLPKNLSPGMHVAAIAFDGRPVAHAKVSIVR